LQLQLDNKKITARTFGGIKLFDETKFSDSRPKGITLNQQSVQNYENSLDNYESENARKYQKLMHKYIKLENEYEKKKTSTKK